MTQNTFPSTWREEPCFLVSVPAPLVPYVGGLLRIAEQRGFWATETDYESAYAALMELEGCLVSTCLDELLSLQRSTYRLLDTALFGTEYTGPTTGDGEVMPAIPNYRSLAFDSYDSALGRLARTADVVDNAINGTSTPEYDYSPSVKQKLQDIIDAIVANAGDDSDLLAQLEIIAGLLA